MKAANYLQTPYPARQKKLDLIINDSGSYEDYRKEIAQLAKKERYSISRKNQRDLVHAFCKFIYIQLI